MKEIGSEFWFDGSIIEKKTALCHDCAVLLSGRTALDYVCRECKIRSISLPSYCCSTMIGPFLQNGVKVQFYDVDINVISYSSEKNCDAVLVIDYFGFQDPGMKQIAKQAHENGQIVIYDSTHRLTGNSDIERYADYSILSYRKWYYCNYAVVRKQNGLFQLPLPERTNEAYIAVREKAAKQKAEFMLNGTVEKQAFLDLYAKANSILHMDYKNYAGIPASEDDDSIVQKRRENAKVLMDGVYAIKGISLWKPALRDEDTPLFVPILFENAEERARVRSYLIGKNIYCPIHWQLSELHGTADSDLYQRELSLVCDQRYGKEEMERELSELFKALS